MCAETGTLTSDEPLPQSDRTEHLRLRPSLPYGGNFGRTIESLGLFFAGLGPRASVGAIVALEALVWL